jgi:copper transport protein
MLSAAALVLAFALALSGHAAAVAGRANFTLLADATHVLGAGGWLGGLLVVLGAGVPAAFALEEGKRGGAVAALVEAFSRTALLFAALLITTGLFGAWVHVGSLGALWQSGYGRTLLVKLALFALVFAAGAYNFLRLRPSLGDEGGARRFRRSATLELVVAVAVLAVTAVLVALPTPGEEGGGGGEHVEHAGGG